MTQNFTIQSSVSLNTDAARAELARLGQEYDALRQRMLQPISVSLNALALPTASAAAPSGQFNATFRLDTADAQRRLADLSRDYDALRQRMMQPVPVTVNVPNMQNGNGGNNGAQPAAVQVTTVQASAELTRLAQQWDALRQRMTQPIPVTVNVGGANGGTGGGGNNTAIFNNVDGMFNGIWAGGQRLLGFFGGITRRLWSGFKGAFSLITGGLKMLVTGPFTLLRTAIGGITGAIQGVVNAFSLMAQVGRTAVSVLTPAAELQQRSMNMQVLLKSPVKAQKRLEELERYAKETNFNPGEVIEASNLMQAFGIHGDDLERLKLAGDAANAFGKDIREVVTSLNYLGSGRGGEAFESLARIGVTREKLKPYGVKFNAQGVLLTDTKKALNAVFKYFEDNFGKATERQAKTFKGALQQAAGEVTYALSHGLQSALAPVTAFVRTAIIPAVSRIGQSLAKIDWKKTLVGPLTSIKKVIDIISTTASRLIDPNTRAAALDELKLLGTGLLESGKTLLDGLLGVGKGLLQDLGATLEGFAKNGVFSNLASTFWNMGKTVLFGFLDAGRLVLSGFSDKFKSDLIVLAESINPFSEKEETTRRKYADGNAEAAVLNDIQMGRHGRRMEEAYHEAEGDLEAERLSRTKKELLENLGGLLSSVQKKEIEDASSMNALRDWQKTAFNVFTKHGLGKDAKEIIDKNSSAQFTREFIWSRIAADPAFAGVMNNERGAYVAREMGWSGGSTKGIESMTSGALKDLGNSLSRFMDGVSVSVSTQHMQAALPKVNKGIDDAKGKLGAYFSQQQRQAAIRTRFNTADERLGMREQQIDEEIEKKEKEYKREKRRIRRGRGSYATLNSIGFSIGQLQRSKNAIQKRRNGLEEQYENAANSQSAKAQGKKDDAYSGTPRRIANINRQYASRASMLRREIASLNLHIKGAEEQGLTEHADELKKKRQVKTSQLERNNTAWRKFYQTWVQPRQGQRPTVPGVSQSTNDGAKKDTTAEIAVNTKNTSDRIVLLATAIDTFLRRQDGLEKTLQQVLEA